MLYAPFKNKRLNFTEGHRIDSIKVSETFLTVINNVSLLTACCMSNLSAEFQNTLMARKGLERYFKLN